MPGADDDVVEADAGGWGDLVEQQVGDVHLPGLGGADEREEPEVGQLGEEPRGRGPAVGGVEAEDDDGTAAVGQLPVAGGSVRAVAVVDAGQGSGPAVGADEQDQSGDADADEVLLVGVHDELQLSGDELAEHDRGDREQPDVGEREAARPSRTPKMRASWESRMPARSARVEA
ncbi:hypothetical protein [Paenarthrobacter sp. C1]|uniref:hypothetical protein n=1 Tax=Paenarthrobacter sp. C1 TaxID=3400220 RepID=UPI003BF4A2DB